MYIAADIEADEQHLRAGLTKIPGTHRLVGRRGRRFATNGQETPLER